MRLKYIRLAYGVMQGRLHEQFDYLDGIMGYK